MNVAVQSPQSQSLQTHRAVFVRRRAAAAEPFVWSGLLPALGLAALVVHALAFFARNDIEASVGREVRAQLAAKGMGWVQTFVSGQQVVLSGTPPAADAAEQALAVARAVRCPTWFGPLVCPTPVVGLFAAAAAPAPAATPASAAEAAAESCNRDFAELLATSRIEFASGRADISPRSSALLDKLAALSKGCPGRITVEGHTDNVGGADANRTLSLTRADAVREALVQRGVPAARMQARGFGADRPLKDNDSAEGRAANRRIEFRASVN